MKRRGHRPLIGVGLGISLAVACGVKPESQRPAGPASSNVAAEDSAAETVSPLQTQLAGLKPAAAQPPSDAQKQLRAAMDAYFRRAGTRRFYMHLDKPLYQPGESIWFRVHELQTASLTSTPSGHGIRVELVSPKGATVLDKRVRVDNGVAANDFILPATVQGGEYTMRVTSDLGGTAERSVIVSQYQPPRIKKKAEFLRKAYGAGDTVAAAVSLSRATGEALANHKVTALVVVDEAEVARVPVTTDDKGDAMVKFALPRSMRRGDGLLTVMVEDGGVTESLQKRIPIVMAEVKMDLYPEGGQLVAGLPGRVYFEAHNMIDKPADIEGRVISASGAEITRFRSYWGGLGRFDLTPNAGEHYFVEITRPAGIHQRIPVPAAAKSGCVLQSVDDYASKNPDLRVGVFCSEDRQVIATAMLRESTFGETRVAVKKGQPTLVSFPVPAGSQGAARVTLFDDDMTPLAERLVYRGRGDDLKVAIRSDRASYSPRDKVTLTVETRDLAGKPVQADLSMAVVNDTVLSFADDKTANMMARLYLESELPPGQTFEEPNFFFSDDAKAPRALDLAMGTKGWRRFEWKQVFAPPPPVTATGTTKYDFDDDMVEGELMAPEAAPEPDVAAARPRPAKAPRRGIGVEKLAEAKPMAPPPPPVARHVALDLKNKKVARDRNFEARLGPAGGVAQGAAARDEDWVGGDGEAQQNRWAWAPVRVFPEPTYEGHYDGPRTDFRETIHWAPSVKTDKNGTAKVSFYLSDAITSFRAIAEGTSLGGLPGRGETLVKSKLPVSLAVKMPLEVSRGDHIQLPITLTNETKQRYSVAVNTTFGKAFKVTGGVPDKVELSGGQSKSFFAELEVVGNGDVADDGAMKVAIDTANLRDEVGRTIKVVPLGFPQEVSAAGTLENKASHTLDLAGALPGTIQASVTLYPSPLATMVKGTEGLVREPYGCFEQASSSNYPNIMILGYLEENDAADPALVAKTTKYLDKGYKMLTGYESPKHGYEWFGGDPGHEALTAYGLMEFADMKQVYGDVDGGMVTRTRAWLRSRRDGKGGYQRNARALDSFGRASPEVTNGYITWALAEAGEKDLGPELAYQKKIAAETKDPYLMAMATDTMLHLAPQAESTAQAVSKLAAMQSEDGAFHGADHSITRSGGQALDIETTSLATMALLDAGDSHAAATRKAVEWLNKSRSGYGNFSSTQATVLALRAMTAYSEASRKTTDGGTVELWVNGRKAGQLSFDKGHKDPLVFADLVPLLKPGKNQVELRLDSKASLPYSIAISYRSDLPASSPNTKVRMSQLLAKDKVAMGEGVRMKVSVENTSGKGIPMTLARVGIPGGLTFQTWQLKELRDKKLIDFYETREREVVLYFRSMAPGAKKAIDLDLMATVPGTYVAPASQSYLYYTDEDRDWVAPVKVQVTR